MAAVPVVRLACAPEWEGHSGHYFHMSQPAQPDPSCDDVQLAAQLWQRTEALLLDALADN